jgi:type IV pilus assembly protein PilN
MRISLNLATRPFADLGPAIKRLRIAMGVLAVLAIGLGFGIHAFHQKAEEARARDHSLDDKIAAITRERQGYQAMMHQPENADVLTHALALNKLFDEKGFSWTLAMEDLETVLPGGVMVTTLEPNREKTGEITLKMRVLGPRDRAVTLVANLEHSRRFLRPRIIGESSESNGKPGEQLLPVSASSPVTFELAAEFNSSAPRETKPSAASRAAEKPASASGASAAQPVPGRMTPVALPPGQRLTRPPYTGPPRPLVPRPRPNLPGAPGPAPAITPTPGLAPGPGGPK